MKRAVKLRKRLPSIVAQRNLFPPGSLPLRDAVFRLCGDDVTRQRIQDRLASGYTSGRADIDWLEGFFRFRRGPLIGVYRPWNILLFFDETSGWESQETKDAARRTIANCWDDMQLGLRHQLYRGQLAMWGRPEPLDKFEEIPIDAWPHFAIADWEHGRGDAAGNHHVFSIHIAPGRQSTERDVPLIIARPGRPTVADWDVLEDLFRKKVAEEGGPPDRGNVKGWRTSKDAIDFVETCANDRAEEPGRTVLGDFVRDLLRKMAEEKLRNL